MRPRAQVRFASAAIALLALAGLWIGHALEYVRVWGTEGLTIVLVGSVHAYMLPFAGVIAVLAGVAGFRLWRIWTRIGLRLDASRQALVAVLRGRDARLQTVTAEAPSLPARLVVAWPLLTALQVALYLAQENLEALRVGLPAPGFGAITGIHALAPAVHAGVALFLLLGLAAVHRLLRRRQAHAERIERAVRRLVQRRVRPLSRTPVAGRLAHPGELLGAELWSRPPPAPSAV